MRSFLMICFLMISFYSFAEETEMDSVIEGTDSVTEETEMDSVIEGTDSVTKETEMDDELQTWDDEFQAWDDEFQAQINNVLSQLIQKDNRLINATNRAGDTALNLIVKNNNVEAVQRLVDAGADVNKANDGGDTPLISVACYNDTDKNVEIAKILMDNGADINAQEDANSLTALHCAVMMQQFSLAVFLLDQEGVDLFLADDDGDTALHILSYVGIGMNLDIEGMEEEEIAKQLKAILENEVNASDDFEEPAIFHQPI